MGLAPTRNELGRQGNVRSCEEWFDLAGKARFGHARSGKAGHGKAWQAGQGKFRFGPFRKGEAG